MIAGFREDPMQSFDESVVPHSFATVEGQRAIWLGGPGCVRHEAVGESFNKEHMNVVGAHVHWRTDAPVPAWLVLEPGAIMVWILGGRVGHLPRELAQQWHPILSALRDRNGGAQIACQATLDPPSAANQGAYGIVVWLPPVVSAPISQRIAPTPPVSHPSPKVVAMPAGVPPQAAPRDVAIAPTPVQQAAPAPVLTPEKLDELRREIERTNTELRRAKRELESVEESLDIQSFGFYQPKYGFESSEQYVSRLDGIKKDQQSLIKDEKAAQCDTKWTVGGSAREGAKMVKQQAKLMLRAFNGECDAAIAKVRYDNVTKLEQRMTKAFEDINKLGQVQQVFISRRYFDLKLAELHLVHEHREKIQEEKEEQKRIREQMKEEQKVQAEIEKARAEAEKEEAKSAAALEKARADLAAAEATSKQHEKLEGLVSRLENELKQALEQKAKAIARAQLTKSGHVYVLSNIGSFGEGVFKIGLTRRLDPYERVDELGDASVPFPFDVHAIIYAEDAPGLESKLHKAFAHRRVNVVNHRKEYFRVTLDDIRDEVAKLHGLVTFQLTPEAEEYNKTRAALAALTELPESGVVPVAGVVVPDAVGAEASR